MTNDIFIANDNIITSLGFTTEENFLKLKNAESGIKKHQNPSIFSEPFCASLVDSNILQNKFEQLVNRVDFTRLEKLFILSINDAMKNSHADLKDKKTLLILSTTKGNIDLLEPEKKDQFPAKRVYLAEMAKVIGQYFGAANTPLVLSNACISGALAIVIGARMIRSGQYENVVVSGGDIVSEFTLSGFQSLMAISSNPCKPYDAKRDGITLGEGCGTVILTSNIENLNGAEKIKVLGGVSSNDANHISGPSRTGEGLNIAIEKALQESKIDAKDVDYISAHGTATVYNDEMEAKAFTTMNLNDVPLNSLKGYWGHTLGAAGVIESIAAIHSMRENMLMPSLGFEEIGVTQPVNIIKKTESKTLNNCLKTASGFGGCNAAVVFSKN
ncbi:MAG: beta-ketoacyl synthase [Flavobacteriales bacterium]|nr:hypothetical protein [Bacteroidales bacterium AH-315-I05]PCJ85265.1 MAG: beta-ketoacyl synthase [Flavobacteriales bacterium]